MFRWFFVVLVIYGLPWAAAQGEDALAMSVRPSADGKQVYIELAELPAISSRLLELVDPVTGEVLRTLWAGRSRSSQTVVLNRVMKIEPGRYILRYRDGLSLTYADKLDGPVNGRWTNPCEIVFTQDAIFVMEEGNDIGGLPEEITRKRIWTLTNDRRFTGGYYRISGGTVLLSDKRNMHVRFQLKEFTPADQEQLRDLERLRLEYVTKLTLNGGSIWKLSRDGKVDPTFGEEGRIRLWQDRKAAVRSFALGSDGKIYASSAYHEAIAYDPNGQRLKFAIGGWDNKPYGSKTTGWVNTLVMGPGDRLYFPTAYGMLRVYDATKPGFTGILYSIKLSEDVGLSPCMTLDGMGNLYLVGRQNSITKYLDDGQEFKRLWNQPAPGGVARLTGPSFSKGLLWVADHGPSKGPYWDSGGGGEVLLFWDDGDNARLIDRFGKVGDAADKPEFMDPSAVKITPDHQYLWVVEDGHHYVEGPSGGARIRKFQITAQRTQEAELDLTSWK